MGIVEVLKRNLPEEVFKEKEEILKKEIGKEMVAKDDFNKVNNEKKSLQSKVAVLEKEKNKKEADLEELTKKLNEKDDEKLSDLEKINQKLESLTETLTQSEAKRAELEQSLQKKEKENKIINIFRDPEIEVDPRYYKYAMLEVADLDEEEIIPKLKEMKKTNKEMFGKTTVATPKPKGSFSHEGKGFFTEEEVAGMSDSEMLENYDKIKESQKKW